MTDAETLRKIVADTTAIAEYASREAAHAWDEVASAHKKLADTLSDSAEREFAIYASDHAKQNANRIWLCLGRAKTDPPPKGSNGDSTA